MYLWHSRCTFGSSHMYWTRVCTRIYFYLGFMSVIPITWKHTLRHCKETPDTRDLVSCVVTSSMCLPRSDILDRSRRALSNLAFCENEIEKNNFKKLKVEVKLKIFKRTFQIRSKPCNGCVVMLRCSMSCTVRLCGVIVVVRRSGPIHTCRLRSFTIPSARTFHPGTSR